MFKLEWKVDGRTVPADRVGTEFAHSVEAAVVDQVKNLIGAVPCPVHHQCASNIQMDRTAGKMNFTFIACCEELKQAIAEHLQ